MPIVVIVIALVATLVLLRRANELCAIRLTDAGTRFIRGRAPARFLSDAEDIVHRARLAGAQLNFRVIRVVSEGGSPRVAVSGAPEAVAQQLRNAAGQHTVAQFRSGKMPR